MRQTPKTVEVLDPINLLVHALAAFGVVGALLSGPLLRFPATAAIIVLSPLSASSMTAYCGTDCAI